jgi:predicted HTH transcriptional regulator
MSASLKELIRSGESNRVEFKKTISQLEKIARTLVAFANSRGGHILLGIQDDGSVSGVGDTEEERYMLEKAALFYCRPEVTYTLEEEESQGKVVLKIEIPESTRKPHRCLSASGEWLLYVRSGDQCILASPLVARSLEMEKEGRDSLMASPVTNNEKALFGFLDKRKRITLKDYAKLINVSKRRAHKILIGLTLSGKLFMHDMERTVFFTRA